VQIDMAQLEEFADSTEKQIRQIGNEMKKEFLQNFTKPIWERQEHDENG
jgi:UDP-galactopyranose mutase